MCIGYRLCYRNALFLLSEYECNLYWRKGLSHQQNWYLNIKTKEYCPVRTDSTAVLACFNLEIIAINLTEVIILELLKNLRLISWSQTTAMEWYNECQIFFLILHSAHTIACVHCKTQEKGMGVHRCRQFSRVRLTFVSDADWSTRQLSLKHEQWYCEACLVIITRTNPRNW